MKPTEMLNKITSLLSTKVELANVKLENGTILEAENFAAGESVFIVTEDEKVPLPIGDYTLEDGKMLMVAEEGIISEITGEMAESEETAETEELDSQVATGSAPRDVEAEKDTEEEPKEKKGKKDLSDESEAEVQEEQELDHAEEKEKDEMTQIVEEVVAAMTPVIDEIKQELTYVKEELGKMKNEELAEVKEKLSSEPAANAIKHSPEVKSKPKFNFASKNKTANSTMDRVLQRMSNINNN